MDGEGKIEKDWFIHLLWDLESPSLENKKTSEVGDDDEDAEPWSKIDSDERYQERHEKYADQNVA